MSNANDLGKAAGTNNQPGYFSRLGDEYLSGVNQFGQGIGNIATGPLTADINKFAVGGIGNTIAGAGNIVTAPLRALFTGSSASQQAQPQPTAPPTSQPAPTPSAPTPSVPVFPPSANYKPPMSDDVKQLADAAPNPEDYLSDDEFEAIKYLQDNTPSEASFDFRPSEEDRELQRIKEAFPIDGSNSNYMKYKGETVIPERSMWEKVRGYVPWFSKEVVDDFKEDWDNGDRAKAIFNASYRLTPEGMLGKAKEAWDNGDYIGAIANASKAGSPITPNLGLLDLLDWPIINYPNDLAREYLSEGTARAADAIADYLYPPPEGERAQAIRAQREALNDESLSGRFGDKTTSFLTPQEYFDARDEGALPNMTSLSQTELPDNPWLAKIMGFTGDMAPELVEAMLLDLGLRAANGEKVNGRKAGSKAKPKVEPEATPEEATPTPEAGTAYESELKQFRNMPDEVEAEPTDYGKGKARAQKAADMRRTSKADGKVVAGEDTTLPNDVEEWPQRYKDTFSEKPDSYYDNGNYQSEFKDFRGGQEATETTSKGNGRARKAADLRRSKTKAKAPAGEDTTLPSNTEEWPENYQRAFGEGAPTEVEAAPVAEDIRPSITDAEIYRNIPDPAVDHPSTWRNRVSKYWDRLRGNRKAGSNAAKAVDEQSIGMDEAMERVNGKQPAAKTAPKAAKTAPQATKSAPNKAQSTETMSKQFRDIEESGAEPRFKKSNTDRAGRLADNRRANRAANPKTRESIGYDEDGRIRRFAAEETPKQSVAEQPVQLSEADTKLARERFNDVLRAYENKETLTPYESALVDEARAELGRRLEEGIRKAARDIEKAYAKEAPETKVPKQKNVPQKASETKAAPQPQAKPQATQRPAQTPQAKPASKPQPQPQPQPQTQPQAQPKAATPIKKSTTPAADYVKSIKSQNPGADTAVVSRQGLIQNYPETSEVFNLKNKAGGDPVRKLIVDRDGGKALDQWFERAIGRLADRAKAMGERKPAGKIKELQAQVERVKKLANGKLMDMPSADYNLFKNSL